MMKLRNILLALALLVLVPKAWGATGLVTTNITFADTIVARVVSEIYDLPIFIVGKNEISNETLNEMLENNITKLIIIGGPAVVSYHLEDILNDTFEVERIWGVTRFETSSLVAQYFWDNSTEAVLVTAELVNEHFAKLGELDLLSQAINLAIEKEIPLLITPTGSLDASVVEALERLGVKKVYLISRHPTFPLIDELQRMNITVETKITLPRVVCDKVLEITINPNDPWWKAIDAYRAINPCVRIRNGTHTNVTPIKHELRLRIRELVKRQIRRRLMLKIREKLFEKRLEALENRLELYKDKLPPALIDKIENWIRIANETKDPKILRKGLRLLLEYKWKHRLYWEDKKPEIVEKMRTKVRERLAKILRKRLRERIERRIKEGSKGRIGERIKEEVENTTMKIHENVTGMHGYWHWP